MALPGLHRCPDSLIIARHIVLRDTICPSGPASCHDLSQHPLYPQHFRDDFRAHPLWPTSIGRDIGYKSSRSSTQVLLLSKFPS
nr:hypothetical protein CFP56_20917 [Quercus suber]